MYDVLIVGAGPAGSVTAKKCAEYGLKTLMVDKRKLPRDKICGGLISDFADDLIKQGFGEIPNEVYCKPPQIAGHIIHVIGADTRIFDIPEGMTWRRNLDFWMNQKAKSAGVELWQNTRVVGIEDMGESYTITAFVSGEKKELSAKFVIGADGTDSTVRKNILPSFVPNYLQAYEEHFPASSLDLDRRYAHDFYSLEYNTVRQQYAFFNCLFKDNFIVLQFTDRVGQVGNLARRGKKAIADNFGFNADLVPVFKGGCLVPMINDELVSRTFLPAKRNVLLVGDAGGLNVLEGLAPSIKSGISAANAIKRVLDSGGDAANQYLADIDSIINRIKEFSDLTGRVNKELQTGGKNLAAVYGEACYEALKRY